MQNTIQNDVLVMPDAVKEYHFHQKIMEVVFVQHRFMQ